MGLEWSYHVSVNGPADLLAHGPERALSGEHHGGSAGPQPSVVVRSISTDNATDGHEQAVFWISTLAPENPVEPIVLLYNPSPTGQRHIPKSGTRSKHKLAQGPHHTVRTSTILKDRNRSFSSVNLLFTALIGEGKSDGQQTDDESHNTTHSFKGQTHVSYIIHSQTGQQKPGLTYSNP